MVARVLAVALGWLLLNTWSGFAAEADGGRSGHPPTQMIGQTVVVGECDPRVWKDVLAVLPVHPARIEILDVNTLSVHARGKVQGFDAFALAGTSTIVVIRQGRTLRQAEFGDGFDRLVLASVVWHELAHVRGADERAAIESEQQLWRRFAAMGRVDASLAFTYIARLDQAKATPPALPASAARE